MRVAVGANYVDACRNTTGDLATQAVKVADAVDTVAQAHSESNT